MSEDQEIAWSRLDNAAKIFPSTTKKTDTRVFRFSCELYENINPEILQNALNKAIIKFPNFLYVMKRGLFWYYLESSSNIPYVKEEYKPPCAKLYNNSSNLLFEVTYYKNRINLEMYHVLSDGTGALQFLRCILYYYLTEKHSDEFKLNKPEFGFDATESEKMDDSFTRYYQKNKNKSKKNIVRSHIIKGKKQDKLQIIEGIISVQEIINLAHKYNTTLTVFLTALFIKSIQKQMSLLSMIRPVTLMIPVNLRKHFPSVTTRNFFGMIKTSYNFQKNSGTLEDIINKVSKTFEHELTKERLSVRMNSLAALEHNPFVKIAPLSFKNFCLRFARLYKDRNETAVISNVGRIDMPNEFKKHIKLFDVFASTLKLQLCLCSFEDKLSLCFTSSFINTNIQKDFFRLLTEQGIKVEIRSNQFNLDGND